MDLFSVVIVGIGVVITTFLAGGYLREFFRDRE